MNKPGRLFKLKVRDDFYMVPKYLYDSYNYQTYLSNLTELDKLRTEITTKFEKVK